MHKLRPAKVSYRAKMTLYAKVFLSAKVLFHAKESLCAKMTPMQKWRCDIRTPFPKILLI